MANGLGVSDVRNTLEILSQRNSDIKLPSTIARGVPIPMQTPKRFAQNSSRDYYTRNYSGVIKLSPVEAPALGREAMTSLNLSVSLRTKVDSSSGTSVPFIGALLFDISDASQLARFGSHFEISFI